MPYEELETGHEDFCTIKYINTNKNVKLYCCPVCYGRGLVPNGFYSEVVITIASDMTSETCRSCWGTGVLWK